MPRRSKVEELKNLLSGNILSPLSLVGFEGIATSGKALLAMTEYSIILAMTYTLTQFMLSVVKNLKVSETVDGSANLEMLRRAQHDIAQHCLGIFLSTCGHSKHSVDDAGIFF